MRCIHAGLAISALLGATIGGATETSSGPEILTGDVDRFFRIFDATNGRPTAEQLQRDYLDAGSEGLKHLAKLRNVTGVRIADKLATDPGLYEKARQCTRVLPQARDRIARALRTLSERYPQAQLPPVTIVIGRGKPVGVGTPTTGIQIGLEALCATDWLNPDVEDRFVFVIVHEYLHVQQSPALMDEDKPTVLQMSLHEGAAEFVTELIAGQPAYSQLQAATAGREKEIETAFVADMDKTDLSDWLFNGTVEKPGDLGYWVGYRVAKSYYQRATDKKQALREIIEMTDAKAFLARSGWHPGIVLK